MKLLLGVLVLVVGTQANANTKKMTGLELKTLLTQLESGGSNKKARPASGVVTVPVEPIRKAKVKAEIFKITIKNWPDGTYTWDRESVCLTHGESNVIDARGHQSVSWSSELGVVCPTTVGGQPASVKITGDLILNNSTFFSDEPPVDSKTASLWMGVTVGTDQVGTAQSEVLIRDLNAQIFLGRISLLPVWKCEANPAGEFICTAADGDYFFATVEVTDTP